MHDVNLHQPSAGAAAASIEVRVDPALAETAVRNHASAGHMDHAVFARYRDELDDLYDVDDPVRRDAAFARWAVTWFHELGLARPLLAAIEERPALSTPTRVLLVGDAGRASDEGVTCEPGGAHLGVRCAVSRFGDPARLLSWARHAMGHAEDTLDPAFGFEPRWDEGAVAAPAAARLHRLWDVTVDSRLADAGHVASAPARRRHVDALAGDLRGVDMAHVEAIVDRLWTGPRPTFGTLARWSARTTLLIEEVLPGRQVRQRPDLCPLCRFPSEDVDVPDADVATLVSAAHPAWSPSLGLCGRCTDRYRLTASLGGVVR